MRERERERDDKKTDGTKNKEKSAYF